MRICIVEDNKPLLENLRLLLEGEPSFSVVGAYPSAEAALREKPWQNADMLLVDIDLPGLSGVDLIRRVHPEVPRLHILVYTISENRDTVFAALKAGAMGYVLKDSAFEELAQAIEMVSKGRTYLSPHVAGTVVSELKRTSRDDGSMFSLLTAREREVLQKISEGSSTKEIASSLGVSVKTIETHRRQIMEKLDLHSVATLTKYAIKEGLTALDK